MLGNNLSHQESFNNPDVFKQLTKIEAWILEASLGEDKIKQRETQNVGNKV